MALSFVTGKGVKKILKKNATFLFVLFCFFCLEQNDSPAEALVTSSCAPDKVD